MAGLCFSWINRQDEHLTCGVISAFCLALKMSSESKKLYKELHKVLVVHGYLTHRQTTYSKIKTKFQISFNFFFFLKVAVLWKHVHKHVLVPFSFTVNQTNPTETPLTTFGHEIVNIVENTLVTNVLRFLKWLLKSSIWCFCLFFFFVLTKHVRICVFLFLY